jgi:hypothetical protein
VSVNVFGVQPVQDSGIIPFVEDDFRAIPSEEMKADSVLVADGEEAPATDSPTRTRQVGFNAIDGIQRNANERALAIARSAQKQSGALFAKAV